MAIKVKEKLSWIHASHCRKTALCSSQRIFLEPPILILNSIEKRYSRKLITVLRSYMTVLLTAVLILIILRVKFTKKHYDITFSFCTLNGSRNHIFPINSNLYSQFGLDLNLKSNNPIISRVQVGPSSLIIFDCCCSVTQ